MNNPHVRQLITLLRKVAEKHGIHETFTTFLELSALAVSNRFDMKRFEERETRYREIAGRFIKSELDDFAQMLAALVYALHHEARTGRLSDVLGGIYHDLALHNRWKSQFFSPMRLCDMMGQIALGDPPRGQHISLHEPCVGSGAMVLGFVNAMIGQERSWTRGLTVNVIDSDLKCVHMAFLQFSLYGIPAIVIHGNSLTQEEWSCWYTAMHFIRL